MGAQDDRAAPGNGGARDHQWQPDRKPGKGTVQAAHLSYISFVACGSSGGDGIGTDAC
jgi:hypothetical protein